MIMERKTFFLELLWEHIAILFFAIIVAALLGGIVGILISEYQKTAKPTLGAINFLYTIPSISMLGFLIPFSGIGNATAIIALTIYTLLPMVRSTHTGISNVDASVIEAAKGMGSTKAQILFKIKIPLAMPGYHVWYSKYGYNDDRKENLLQWIGSSGCGKTTILKMVNGLIQPTEGKVMVNGNDITEKDMIELRRNIGYAIQGSVLFAHMTIEQTVRVTRPAASINLK